MSATSLILTLLIAASLAAGQPSQEVSRIKTGYLRFSDVTRYFLGSGQISAVQTRISHPRFSQQFGSQPGHLRELKKNHVLKISL